MTIKPPSPPYDFSSLKYIMAALRNKENGCPWDIAQTYETIIPYTLEEAYEVADAIAKKDYINLREELGDLLLQSIYHAQMAAEDKYFTIDEVLHDVCHKMVTRHPHVFDEDNAVTPEDVDKIWDQQKDKEKAETLSLMDEVPAAFPALLRAHKLQKKAAKVGFEWPDTGGVIDKLQEEIAELNEAIKNGDSDEIQDELGDVFFTLVNYTRMNGMNAEDTLRLANNKFEKRFRKMEEILTKENKKIQECTLKTMETAWEKAKTQEKT